MAVHIGKIVKGLVKEKGLGVTEFADKINYSRRNVYEIFDRETIDTGLLIKIGKVLEQNLFLLYISEKEILEHQANKKTSNEEFVQTVEKLKKIVNELGLTSNNKSNPINTKNKKLLLLKGKGNK